MIIEKLVWPRHQQHNLKKNIEKLISSSYIIPSKQRDGFIHLGIILTANPIKRKRLQKSGSVGPEIDLSDNLQENTDYETGCTRNELREGESTGTVFLRLLEVRGPRRSLSPPPASVPCRAHARGESRFQRPRRHHA